MCAARNDMYWKRFSWCLLLLLIAVSVGFFRLRLDVEVLNLLPQDSSVVQGLRLYQQNFSNARQLFITVKSESAETSEAAARSLATALQQHPEFVASAVWQPPWLEYPAQASEFLAYLWLNQLPGQVAALTNRLSHEHLQQTLTDAREQLSTSLSPRDVALGGYDPFGLSRLPESSAAGAFGNGDDLFASADGKFRIVFVESKADLRSYRDCADWLQNVKKVVQAELPHLDHIEVHYTGRPAFVAEIAGAMEKDMTESVGLTAVIIAILFWISHRRIVPMLWLLTLLAVILVCTIGLSGLVFGTLNVVSLGFAGILLGLAVDYGVVHYQEALAKPSATIPQIRRAIRPSITWAAVTTISAFLVLNLGGMPGLGQLGTTVAIGVALSALVMLFVFLPPLFRDRTGSGNVQQHQETFAADPLSVSRRKGATAITVALVAVTAAILLWKHPTFDNSPAALRPRNSEAYATLDAMKVALGRSDEPLWLIVPGKTEQEVATRLVMTERHLEFAKSNALISGFTLPSMLWPQPAYQSDNLKMVRPLIARKGELEQAALANDFTTNSLVLANNVFATWNRALDSTNVFWPGNFVSRWIINNLTARTPEGFLAMGLVYPNERDAGATARFAASCDEQLRSEGVLLSGWSLLGSDMFHRVQHRFPMLVTPMIILVLLSLWLAFRAATEIGLSLLVLLLSGSCLLAVMAIAGWQWNLMNMMAVPLILGAGVDYSIFMQLALKRHRGNLRESYHAVGRALLLCGGTAVAGFASLALSSNAGMASLGVVCAIGIGFNMVISVYLLPVWWRLARRQHVLPSV